MINNIRSGDEMFFQPDICIPQELVIENVRLAAAYVPYQYLCELFNPIESLANGTAFPELFSPFDKRDKCMPSNLSEC